VVPDISATVTGTDSPTRAAGGSADPAGRRGYIDGSGIVKSGRWGRYEVLGQLGAGGMGVVFEAHDPSLHRKVALKLLQPRHNRSSADAARRLAVEAQAMARLAHPNVVTVFEIDRVGEQVYVAMELVAGTTLRGWLGARRRRWREILQMFTAAGRGLAAAHAAGLVHRDFKPDNVLIGSDGRPRVCDFGLVVDADGDGDAELPGTPGHDGGGATRASGTPAYMSAEQWTGQPVDARSDQFAFCVALWEALYESRPFSGRRWQDVRAAACSGVIAEPQGGRRVPRWLLAMMRRGLSVDPQARWPDMTTLLDALERRAAAGRRRAIAAVAVAIAVASATVAAAVAGSRGALDPCGPPTDRLASAWGPVRAIALRVHLLTVDPVQGPSRFATSAATIAAAAESWSDMYVAACRATRVEGRQSDALLDRRMQCLDRWLVELDDTVDVVAQANDPAAVDRSVAAAASLSPLDVCADVRALDAAPPPASAADRVTAVALANRTRELDVAQRAGRLEGLAPRATELVAAARALGHAPTLAGALVVQVRIINRLAERGLAEPILRELIDVAARLHDDRSEAFAWTNLMVMMSQARGKTDDALALVPSARAAVLRAGDPIDLRADLLYAHAIVLDSGARPAEGLVLLEEERHLLEQAGASSPLSPLAGRLCDALSETATSYLKSEHLDASISAAREAIERRRAISGPDSLDEADGWQNLSVALQRAGRFDEALAAIKEAGRLRAGRLGTSAALALTLVAEASVLDDLGRWDQSVAVYERALAMSRATLPPGDVTLARALINSGLARSRVRRFDDALRDFNEAIALFENAGSASVNLAIALNDRGDVVSRRGDCAQADRDFTRSIELLDKLHVTHYVLRYPLNGKGACLVRSGRPAEAIPLLERAQRIKTGQADTSEIARTKVYLGWALVDTRRDVAGGLAMVRAARAAMVAGPDSAEEVPMLDRWLAAHTR
jgi:tetratricopeptide (TPR) repeat protein